MTRFPAASYLYPLVEIWLLPLKLSCTLKPLPLVRFSTSDS